jgi:hypothetical protein
MTKLSHTMVTKLLTCPYQYKAHYVDKLRSKYTSSPLFFGTALDRAFNLLLLSKKDPLEYTEDEHKLLAEGLSPEQVYTKNFNNIYLNGNIITPTSPLVKYSKKDLDLNFVDDEDKEFAEYCINNYGKLSKEDFIEMNHITANSLYKKGLILLKNYENEILPNILKIHHIQKKFEIKEQSMGEHSLGGDIDFIAEFVDEPGVKYICDNKTSSKSYTKNSVRESPQLATYGEVEGILKGAYCVVRKDGTSKGIYKTQIIKDDIVEDMIEETFQNYVKALDIMDSGEFPKNKNACFQFGRHCDLYNHCHKGDDSDLVCLKKDKE